MCIVDIDQEFHRIGQGLFYSGELQVDSTFFHAHFNFVYDCGSVSGKKYLTPEIKNYQRLRNPTGHIDLLIVSHFHQDHVNGLDALLKSHDVSTVVLPYLSPGERLVLAFKRRSERWYKDFLVSPSKFLLSRGAKQVIYLTRGNDESHQPPEGRIDRSWLYEDPHKPYLKVKGLAKEGGALREEVERDVEFDSSEVDFRSDAKPLQWGGIWQFLLHVEPIEPSVRKALDDCVYRNVAGTDFAKALSDSSVRKQLKLCYERTVPISDFNATSLACLHGPMFHSDHFLDWDRCGSENGAGLCLGGTLRCRNTFLKLYLENSSITRDVEVVREAPSYCTRDYCYLTGDMRLDKVWQPIVLKRYRRFLPRVQLLQVPHHGAAMNWSTKVVNMTGSATYVISAGTENRYGHPSQVVLDSICGAVGRDNVWWVNEYRNLHTHRCYLPFP